MKLDFHTHGKLAKKLPLSTQYTDWLFEEAKEAGLDAICLTEHFNTLQFDELYAYILGKSRRERDTLVLENGLRIFSGMETDIAEGGHILSLGSVETILELNRKLTPYKAPGSFLSFRKLMDLSGNTTCWLERRILTAPADISRSCPRSSLSVWIFSISTARILRRILAEPGN